MKKSMVLFLLLCMPLFVFTQNLTDEETELYNLIMQYRYSKGLPNIPLSKSLTFVAQTHVQDLADNKPDVGNCNTHSWSNKGNWTPCCYTSNHAKSECMWDKPSELTSYTGYGYEIAYWSSGTVNAKGALNGWKSSAGHNSVIVNQSKWHDNNWQAIGVGIYKNYAVVWFGEEID